MLSNKISMFSIQGEEGSQGLRGPQGQKGTPVSGSENKSGISKMEQNTEVSVNVTLVTDLFVCMLFL